MKHLNEKVAVITGAGSGIGRATAIELSKEGCRLAISDINEEQVQETQRIIEGLGNEVHSKMLDVTDRNAFYTYADEVAKKFGKVNLVINNAGVNVFSNLENTRYEDFEWIMNINFWGMVYGTKAFLPYLKKSGDGHIANVSSLFGIVAPPNSGAYNASKFAIRGFNETLRAEMKIHNYGINVSSIHPGGIKTNIVRHSRNDPDFVGGTDPDVLDKRFQKIAKVTPEEAAKTIIKGIKKNKMRILIGRDALMFDLGSRLSPNLVNERFTSMFKAQYDRAKSKIKLNDIKK